MRMAFLDHWRDWLVWCTKVHQKKTNLKWLLPYVMIFHMSLRWISVFLTWKCTDSRTCKIEVIFHTYWKRLKHFHWKIADFSYRFYTCRACWIYEPFMVITLTLLTSREQRSHAFRDKTKSLHHLCVGLIYFFYLFTHAFNVFEH